MRIAHVVGTVTLSRWHPEMQGARLRLVQPLSLAELRGESDPQADEIVAWDEYNAGQGHFVAISEGAEAAQPFRPNYKPVDTYISAILDHLDIQKL